MMTVEDEAICTGCVEALDLLQTKGIPSVCLLDRNTRRSQFENYKELFLRRYFEGDEWLLFTDDDDEWHAERVSAYSTVLARDPDCERPLLIPMKQAPHGDHYVSYAVRARVFKSFLKHASPESLAHVYADCYWVRSLYQNYALGVRKLPLPVTIDVLYHWRRAAYATPPDAELTPLMLKRYVELLLANRVQAEHTVGDLFRASAAAAHDLKYMTLLSQLLIAWDKEGVLQRRFPDLALFYPNDCAGCGMPLAPSTCARCGTTKYCGTECQKAHWKRHKAGCKKDTV